MSSVRERLLAAAAVRTREVEIAGEAFVVREPGADAFGEYGRLARAGDKEAALALLLAACVVGEDGKPALSAADAAVIASSARVCIPLLNAIMEVAGFQDEEPPASQPDASRAVRPSAGRAARSNGRGNAEGANRAGLP